jgi:hypothetical protein
MARVELSTVSISVPIHFLEEGGGSPNEGVLWHAATEFGLVSISRVHRQSPTMGAAPPQNAQVLFDGESTRHFVRGRISADGYLKAGTETVGSYRDVLVHLEFRVPHMPNERGQARGNSGVYLQKRYEVQILDSFGHPASIKGCGSLYGERRPDVNMCFAPGVWQTYDIRFRAPRYDRRGIKQSNARITVFQNGVIIHENVELPCKTGSGSREGPEPGPLELQSHGSPVVFRNVWLVELNGSRTT